MISSRYALSLLSPSTRRLSSVVIGRNLTGISQSKILRVDPTLIHKYKHNYDEEEWYTYASTPPTITVEAKKINNLQEDETKAIQKKNQEDTKFWKN